MRVLTPMLRRSAVVLAAAAAALLAGPAGAAAAGSAATLTGASAAAAEEAAAWPAGAGGVMPVVAGSAAGPGVPLAAPASSTPAPATPSPTVDHEEGASNVIFLFIGAGIGALALLGVVLAMRRVGQPR